MPSTHVTPRSADTSLLDLPDEVLLLILIHLGLQPKLTPRVLRSLQPAFNLSLVCTRLHRIFCSVVRSIDLQTAEIIHEPFSSRCEHSASHLRSLLRQLGRLDTVTLTEKTALAADALLHENDSDKDEMKNSDGQSVEQKKEIGVRRLRVVPSSGRMQTNLTGFPKSCRELVLTNPSVDTLRLLAQTYVVSSSSTTSSSSTSSSPVQDKKRTAYYHCQNKQHKHKHLSQLRDLTLSHVDIRHRDLVITIAQKYIPQLYHLNINFAASMTDMTLRTQQLNAIVHVVAAVASIVREKGSKMFVLSLGVSELTKSPAVRDANVHRLVKLVERMRKKNGPIIEASVLRRMVAEKEKSEGRERRIRGLCPEQQRNSDAYRDSDSDSDRDTVVGVEDDVEMSLQESDVDRQTMQNEDDQSEKIKGDVKLCTTITETTTKNDEESIHSKTINSSSTTSSTISKPKPDTSNDNDYDYDYIDAFGDSEDNKETARLYTLFKRAFGPNAQPTVVHLSADITHIHLLIRAARPVLCAATALMAQAGYDGWLFNPMVDTLRYITYMQRSLPALVQGASCVVGRPFSMLVGESLSEITVVDYAVLPLFCYSEAYRRSLLRRVNIAGMIDSLCVLVRLSENTERIEKVAQLTCEGEEEDRAQQGEEQEEWQWSDDDDEDDDGEDEGEENDGDEGDLPTDEVIDDNIEEDLAVVVRRCGEVNATEIAQTFLLDFVRAVPVGIESIFVSFEVAVWCVDMDNGTNSERREGGSSSSSSSSSNERHSGMSWMVEWMEALTKTEKLTFTMPTDPPGADPVDHRCVGIDQRFLIGLGGIALLVAEKKEIMPKLRLFAVENLGERLNWVSDDGEKSKKEGGDKNVDGMMMKMVIDQTIERIIYLQRSRTEVEVESVLALLEAWRTGLLTSGHSSMTMSPKIRNDRVSEYE